MWRVVPEARDKARVVMVGEKNSVPIPCSEDSSMGVIDAFEIGDRVTRVVVLAPGQTNGVEVEHHVKLLALSTNYHVFSFKSDTEGLPYGHDVVLGEDFAIHLLKVLVAVRAAGKNDGRVSQLFGI